MSRKVKVKHVSLSRCNIRSEEDVRSKNFFERKFFRLPLSIKGGVGQFSSWVMEFRLDQRNSNG